MDFLKYVFLSAAKGIGACIAMPFMIAALVAIWPVTALIEGYERDKVRRANERRWEQQRKAAAEQAK